MSLYGRNVQIFSYYPKRRKWYVSWCPELDIANQGETIEEAIENLKEAIEFYLEDEDTQIPAADQVFTTTVEVSSLPKLPTPSAREVIRALSSQGFQVVSFNLVLSKVFLSLN